MNKDRGARFLSSIFWLVVTGIVILFYTQNDFENLLISIALIAIGVFAIFKTIVLFISSLIPTKEDIEEKAKRKSRNIEKKRERTERARLTIEKERLKNERAQLRRERKERRKERRIEKARAKEERKRLRKERKELKAERKKIKNQNY